MTRKLVNALNNFDVILTYNDQTSFAPLCETSSPGQISGIFATLICLPLERYATVRLIRVPMRLHKPYKPLYNIDQIERDK